LFGSPLIAVASLGYILQEPTPRLPLDTNTLIPLLQSNASALKELTPPISHPLSLLSHLTSLPPPPPYTLPSGDVISPPEPSGIPPRKLVIFGDCAGGTENSTFQSMCADPSLLIHECTNAAIPELVQRGEKGRKVRMKGMDDGLVQRSEDQTGKQVGKEDAEVSKSESERKQREEEKRVETRRKAQSRGHSTPDEVGEFAKLTRARRVVVNHFSAMQVAQNAGRFELIAGSLRPGMPRRKLSRRYYRPSHRTLAQRLILHRDCRTRSPSLCRSQVPSCTYA
jgi:ribonuclease Z